MMHVRTRYYLKLDKEYGVFCLGGFYLDILLRHHGILDGLKEAYNRREVNGFNIPRL